MSSFSNDGANLRSEILIKNSISNEMTNFNNICSIMF